MGRKIDLDDLIDAGDVAELLGLASRKVVAAARSSGVGAWCEFPAPVIERGPCHFWVRQDVEEWNAKRKRGGRRQTPQ